jgi:hypothetical protein
MIRTLELADTEAVACGLGASFVAGVASGATGSCARDDGPLSIRTARATVVMEELMCTSASF